MESYTLGQWDMTYQLIKNNTSLLLNENVNKEEEKKQIIFITALFYLQAVGLNKLYLVKHNRNFNNIHETDKLGMVLKQ